MRVFEKAFTLPFEECYGRFSDKNDKFGFQFCDYSFSDAKTEKLLKIINGEMEPDVDKLWEHQDGYISCEGKRILQIRGWGYLTGCGGGLCLCLCLSPKEATAIQDDLANYIVERLTVKK